MTPAPNTAPSDPPPEPPDSVDGSPTHPTTADEAITALALRARQGCPQAVERFVRATRPDVWRYVAHLSGDHQAADDLTQETYLRVLRGLPRFEGRSSARTWLLSIARRAVADRFRHTAARPRLADATDWQLAAERAQPRGLPGFEEGIALRELLDALPDERRKAFVLTHVVGLPYAEAADITGCPVGTVRSRVARARASLIGSIEAAESPPDKRPARIPVAA
jgi:RNA polymerase sigma-70 factor, ECF subfamily